MRKLAIALALATTALATPAVAADHTWYAGVEGGGLLVEDSTFDAQTTFRGVTTNFNNNFKIDHKKGYDLDLIGGYDFGMFRAEVEAGYKRASLSRLAFTPNGGGFSQNDISGSVRAYSVMGNLLLDFGPEDGWNGYVGGGAGLANVRYKINSLTGSGSDSDRSVAFQGIAGIRKSISDNIDLGLKYRYFVAPRLDYNIDLGSTSTKFKSHSLMASLIFNFAPPPPPPIVVEPVAPPPPPPPATQTCPDGSVILATDVCPSPPPPPPPAPEPVPERG